MDLIGARILRVLQEDAPLSQRDLADRVRLPQNVC
ncbi:MAG: Lrp/AsnC family transcriptional regulator [Litoreibacter sp.]